jgi:hypothetical protein
MRAILREVWKQCKVQSSWVYAESRDPLEMAAAVKAQAYDAWLSLIARSTEKQCRPLELSTAALCVAAIATLDLIAKGSIIPSANETAEQRAARYQRTLEAIRDCTLEGVDFGDWVQAAVEDALDGIWPECWKCGTPVHEGACVGDGESE